MTAVALTRACSCVEAESKAGMGGMRPSSVSLGNNTRLGLVLYKQALLNVNPVLLLYFEVKITSVSRTAL